MMTDEGMMRAACVMRESVDKFILRDFSYDLERLNETVERFVSAVDRLVELQNPDDGK